MKGRPVLRQLHLGGGTPTFFSPANLGRLCNVILGSVSVHPEHEFSVEGHPNNTTMDHLQTLFAFGFRRISYGVQDCNEEVQKIINRIQPFSVVELAVKNARQAGFTSVNLDLIYGLPAQTCESIRRTFDQVIGLKPDRVAFYSYAHMPHLHKSQTLFSQDLLPSAEEKLDLYLTGKSALKQSGFQDVGMDHFSLPDDELFIAKKQGKLHRNFMGYTVQPSSLLIGLGVSAISDSGLSYAQNEKNLHDYYLRVRSHQLPVHKGYTLTSEDRRFRKYILDIICRGEANFDETDLASLHEYTFPKLREFQNEGLLIFNSSGLLLMKAGLPFVRNICSAFDLVMERNRGVRALFSKAV